MLPALLAGTVILVVVACTPLPRGIEHMDGRGAGPDQGWHRGPEVVVQPAGTARFVRGFVEGIDEAQIRRLVGFADALVAAPASPGYDRVLDELARELEAAGFRFATEGLGAESLLLEWLEGPATGPGWTPISGSIELIDGGGRREPLHAFADERDVERVILPVHAPSTHLTARVSRSLDELNPGEILVTEVSARQVLQRVRGRGAVAIVSASLGSYNTDPTGAGRHLDAIQARALAPNSGLPAFQISRASLKRIDEAIARTGSASLALSAEVAVEDRPQRTLVATVVGTERPDEAVVVSAHAQGPGAVNNASGVAGVVAGVTTLCRRIEAGELQRPDRSLVFVFGDELRGVEHWLASTRRRPVAGLCADMIGSRADSGAIALLEREPDPGAWLMFEPDRPSSWGGGKLDDGDWTPSGLSVLARCAMIDTGLVEGAWTSADHPWEGGSDHDVLLAAGVPAVLFWHFTDFTFATSLDRAPMVDPAETRRTAAAILTAASALASPEPGDLDRYLRSLDLERRLRVDAALDAKEADVARAWEAWARGARAWLRNLCLGIDEPLPTPEEEPTVDDAPTSEDAR
ncbi:MAG: M28 family peptidase [Planctomycetota bacterium]